MLDLGIDPPVRAWLSEPLAADIKQSLARLAACGNVLQIAVMPDVHLASEVCVGVALATSERIYPAAVGNDIGCGISTVRLEAGADLLTDEQRAASVLGGLYRSVPCHRHAQMALPEELASAPLSDARLERLKQRDGRVQFGTLGRGNHFLELQADGEEQLWIMVHSGSRAIGQAIANHHLARCETENGLPWLDANSTAGQAYLADMQWALHYASASRLAMLRAVESLFGVLFRATADWSSYVDVHHNHVLREAHAGREFWVHRKGAQRAGEDEPGLIPGSMGTASFHTLGRGCGESLCSSSHGAGRKLSRTEARKHISSRQLERSLGAVWFDHRRAAALREEAPDAYKDIRAVMRAQAPLVKIVRELRPILSYKGT
jgi:tRNA-splicing ligase RtcB